MTASDATVPVSLPAPRTERLGYLYMVLSSLTFGLMGALVKVASRELPIEEVSFFRAFGGLVLLSAWMIARRIPLRLGQPGVLLARGVLGWAALTAYFYAIARLYLADAVLLNYTSPFFTALFAGLFLKERLTPTTMACLAVATAGVAFVVGPHGAWRDWGAIAGLGSAVAAGLAYVAVKQATATNSPWVVVWAFSATATVLTLPMLLGHSRTPTFAEGLLLAGVALSATIAQTFMTYGYQAARASTAGVITLATPLIAALLGIVWFHDAPTWGTWVGGTLILLAGSILAVRSR